MCVLLNMRIYGIDMQLYQVIQNHDLPLVTLRVRSQKVKANAKTTSLIAQFPIDFTMHLRDTFQCKPITYVARKGHDPIQ